MNAIYDPFIAMLKEKREDSQLLKSISELSFEIALKEISTLKENEDIQQKVGTIFEALIKILHEKNLISSAAIGSIFDGILKATNSEKEALLYKTICEKELLEKSVERLKKEIGDTLNQSFTVLEKQISILHDEIKDDAFIALNDAKLRGIEIIGILKETTTEALLTTLEKGNDITETAQEITKHLVFQTITEGKLSIERILDISKTIIATSAELANEDISRAKELLTGSIEGVREGISKAIDRFKTNLKYAPSKEMEALLQTDLEELKKDLNKIDDQFIDLLNTIANETKGVSESIIKEMTLDLNSSSAKIRRAVNEAREVIAERIEQLKENAEKSFEELKQDMSERAEKSFESLRHIDFEAEARHAADEAKKLGHRAWQIAKSMVDGALKGAKEAMDKEEKK